MGGGECKKKNVYMDFYLIENDPILLMLSSLAFLPSRDERRSRTNISMLLKIKKKTNTRWQQTLEVLYHFAAIYWNIGFCSTDQKTGGH